MRPKIFILAFLCFIALISCAADREPDTQSSWWKSKAEKMVEEQLRGRDITDKKVLKVMEQTPRHMFMPEYLKYLAYEDHPFPIGHGQTISQPYIVALMTELLKLNGSENVLEIGTGSGYQAAILSKLAAQVYTIEIIPALADEARVRLAQMGYANVRVITGDGYKGLPQFAPFDSIIVTAAPEEIPPALVEQLKTGGKMVIPVGDSIQQLMLITKTSSGIKKESIVPVRFVPMVSE